MARVGVFVCWCGANIAETVDSTAVADYARTLPDVVVSMDYRYTCSDPGQRMITDAIREHELTGVVVASCSPRMHEATFRKTAALSGLNPYMLEMANIREHCSWVHTDREAATAKAKDLVRLIVEKVRRNHALSPIKVPVTQRVMVVGGGIAGIQAALDVAAAGYEVVLVERQPSIGGHMAQLDETFPTLDCSQCIMTPRMVDIAQSDKITLYSYSEIEAVDGYVGNFDVKIRRKTRFVDEDKCTGCGECSTVCPVEMPNAFNEGLGTRRAVYIPFPQAVPKVPVIEKRGRAPCRSGCPAGVHARGYVQLIRKQRYTEAIELLRQDMPLPSACGRVCYHPCEASCERSQVDEPVAICALKRFVADRAMAENAPVEPLPVTHEEKVAVIGSGPAGLACANEALRRGYAVTVFEAAEKTGGMVRYGIPAYRLPDDVLDWEVDYLSRLGIEIKTGAKVTRPRELLGQGYQAVFIAVGAQAATTMGIPGEELQGVTGMLEFLHKVNDGDLDRLSGTVAVIGGGNSAMDAARAAIRLGADAVRVVYRRSRAEMPAHEWEIEEAEREGVEFDFLAAPVRVEGRDGRAETMVCIRMELGEPDASGRRRPVPVEGSEFEVPVQTVIPAIGQTTDLGELAEGMTLTRWNTIEVDPVTHETGVPGVFAGGDVATGAATVVEAFAAGKRAAESIDRYLRKVDLAEDREHEVTVASAFEPGLESKPRTRETVLPVGERAGNFREIVSAMGEEDALAEADRCLGCGVCCECMACVAKCEAGAINHEAEDRFEEEKVGAIIVATGYELADPSALEEYGYGRYPDVVTSLEFERMVSASGPTGGEVYRPSTFEYDENGTIVGGEKPKSCVFIQCVGSRTETNGKPYCSKICCMVTAKHTILYQHKVHGGDAYVFFMDVRSAGKNYEEFVRRAVKDKTATYIRGRVAKVFGRNGNLVVRGADTLLGSQVEIDADMVVLAPAVVPSDGAVELAQKLRIGYDTHAFFNEAHPKLKPVETNTAGIFLAGACQAPKDIPEAVAQASGAAAKALGLVSRDEYEREPTVAHVNLSSCNGCFECLPVCAYTAISEHEVRNRNGDLLKIVADINEGLCQGCGACAVTCRSKSIEVEGFSDEQLYAEISALVP